MLTRRILTSVFTSRALPALSSANIAVPRVHNQVFNLPRRAFSDESNFEGHSDFAGQSKVSGGDEALFKQFDEWVNSSDLCIFMKGTRKMPRCGFSNYVVQIFKFYGVKEYKAINVLEDESVREGIKKFSNWPTIPQVYVKGQFLGGCDIMKEMHADGSLEELLIREGLIKGEVMKK